LHRRPLLHLLPFLLVLRLLMRPSAQMRPSSRRNSNQPVAHMPLLLSHLSVRRVPPLRWSHTTHP
jgi:hypothetical protein